jgi:hypothetical protein
MNSMARNQIANCKTVEGRSDHGEAIYAVVIGVDLPDVASASSFIEEVAEKFKQQRMMSPPTTSMLLITLIGEIPGMRFVERWRALAAQDDIFRFFMARMTKADLICASPEGGQQETFSLLLPAA